MAQIEVHSSYRKCGNLEIKSSEHWISLSSICSYNGNSSQLTLKGEVKILKVRCRATQMSLEGNIWLWAIYWELLILIKTTIRKLVYLFCLFVSILWHFNLCRLFNGNSIFYPSTEKQLVYSTAPVDWAKGNWFEKKSVCNCKKTSSQKSWPKVSGYLDSLYM